MPKRVFIGTAGWGIPRERAGDFPHAGSGLARYARLVGATEINTTFYRRHLPATFERWEASVPASFRFAVKLPRAITHDADLAAPRRPLREFFDDVSGLGKKLGPVLVQLPPSAVLRPRRAAAFFDAMRALHAGPIACEPRHPSWYTDDASSMLERYDVARVVADPARPDAARFAGGAPSLVYFRLHGSPRRYWSSYDDVRLRALAAELSALPAATTTWCIFDNTASGAALANALALMAIVGS